MIADQPWRRRALIGWVAGVGQFGVGLWWMTEFTLPGGVLAILFSALFVGLAAVLTPPASKWRMAAFPAALLLAEAARVRWPFGGTPPGGTPLGQAGGLFAPAARIGGPLVLVALAALAGVVFVERGVRRYLAGVAVVVVLVVAGIVAPAGSPTGRRIDVALVQGGGVRGYRAIHTDPEDVYQRHLDATAKVRDPIDLLVWPEDVIDVNGDIARTDIALDLADIALRHHATFVAGAVEGEGTDHFRNVVVAVDPDGRIVDRYEKVHRVPFGEYVPFRSIVDKLADLSAVPDDAIVGRGPNVLRTPAGRLGVAISYEVFFADRGRAATHRGAGVMLVPTNAASFHTTQVPTQELAAARLLAVTSGRTVLQAGPTGYTAVVTHDGRVRVRSVLGRQQVIQARITLRHGRTPYAVVGDWPWLLAAAVAVLTGFLTERSRVPRTV